MNEIVFFVEEMPDGGFIAHAPGVSIITETDDSESLYIQIRDAVHCHFSKEEIPQIIRLFFIREEIITV